MHLRYKMTDAAIGHKETRHPIAVMDDLGITWQHATPKTIADQWWFWNCENVPGTLPCYITTLELDPLKQIGNGLDEQTAREIAERAKSAT